jgi:hypothetical protein
LEGDAKELPFFSCSSKLSQCFVWSNTPQGEASWRSIANQLNSPIVYPKLGTPEGRKIVAMLAREYRRNMKEYKHYGGAPLAYREHCSGTLYRKAKAMLGK